MDNSLSQKNEPRENGVGVAKWKGGVKRRLCSEAQTPTLRLLPFRGLRVELVGCCGWTGSSGSSLTLGMKRWGAGCRWREAGIKDAELHR